MGQSRSTASGFVSIASSNIIKLDWIIFDIRFFLFNICLIVDNFKPITPKVTESNNTCMIFARFAAIVALYVAPNLSFLAFVSLLDLKLMWLASEEWK